MIVSAYCPHCDLTFASRTFQISRKADVSGITLMGNQESCPRCGKLANTMSASFSVKNGILGNFNSLEKAADDLRKLQHIAEQVQAGKLIKEDADKQVSDLGIEVAEAWRLLGNNSGQITVLLTMIGLMISVYIGIQSYRAVLSTGELEKRQLEAIQKLQEDVRKIPEASAVEEEEELPPGSNLV